jgi:hypothetical protein
VAVRDVGWLMAGVAAGTGSVMVMRGSLHDGIALAGIDILGFFITHRILYRRRATGAPCCIELAPVGAAAEPSVTANART